MEVYSFLFLVCFSLATQLAAADDSSRTEYRFSPIQAVRATGAYLLLKNQEKAAVQQRLADVAIQMSTLAHADVWKSLLNDAKARGENTLVSLAADNVTTTASSENVTMTTMGPTPLTKCEEHVVLLIEGLIEQQPWAVDMIDAMGKPVPDVKGGRTFWLGAYDECVAVAAANSSNGEPLFRGRYCTVIVPLQVSDLHPPIPGAPSTGVRVGLCVPDSCSGDQVTGIVNTAYDIVWLQWPRWRQAEEERTSRVNGNSYTPSSDVNPTIVNVTQSGEHQPLLEKGHTEQGDITPSKLGKFLLAFSVYSNGRKLLSTSHAPDSITCVHGIRFLSMTWVILGHTYAFGLTTSANYLTYLANSVGLWTFQAIIGAPVTVDSFFVLSGLLVTYLILKEMERRNGKVQWFLFYFHRFWRLTPPYMLVIMVYVPLFRYLASGPNWSQDGVEFNNCRDTWWTNLLYINNFVRTSEMCITWSWYLANDMQFYIISPLIFVPLYFHRRLGLLVALVFLLATVITAGILARKNDFPPTIGLSEANPSASADYFFDFYIKPYCRFGPYVVGMLTGYLLFITKCTFRLPLMLNLGGWAAAAAVALADVYGLHDAANGHPLSADGAAAYNALSHTAWGFALCWVIFACATGNGGPVNTVLSWEALIPLSRLTYMAYLVHPIIMELVYLSSPALFYMSHINCAMAFLSFTVAAFGVALILSLAFEAPMMGLEKLVLPTHRRK